MKKLIIEKHKIIDNLNKLRSITNTPIIATLKNNGYGLGLDEFPKLLEENKEQMTAESKRLATIAIA